MSAQHIQNPADFIRSLGRLHDVEIEQVEFNADAQLLTLMLTDINANFTETPEYEGSRPCALIFLGVTALTIDVVSDEGIRMAKAVIVEEASTLRMEIDLNLGGGPPSAGRRSIVAKFQQLQIRDA